MDTPDKEIDPEEKEVGDWALTAANMMLMRAKHFQLYWKKGLEYFHKGCSLHWEKINENPSSFHLELYKQINCIIRQVVEVLRDLLAYVTELNWEISDIIKEIEAKISEDKE